MKAPIIIWFVVLLLVSYLVYTAFRMSAISQRSTNPPIIQASQLFGSGAKKITYVAAGDSTAVGQGASTVENTYPYLVGKYLSHSGATIDYSNVAVGGAKTQDLLDSQIQKIIDAKPDIVTISIGANNLTHLHTNSSILQDDQLILTKLLENTNADIYLTDIPNFYGATYLPKLYIQLLEFKAKSLNPEIIALATDRIHIVDIHNFGWDQYTDISTTISSDQFHPNDLGYQNWANAFISSLKDNGK